MSLEYVERKIAQALKMHNGNALLARQQVMAWAVDDSKLLIYLTKSHLSGIVAYNVDRVISGRAAAARKAEKAEQAQAEAESKSRARAQAQKPATKQQSQPTQKQPAFGTEILKAVASSSSEVFGLEHLGDMQKPGKVSQKHIDAIRAIAKNKKT